MEARAEMYDYIFENQPHPNVMEKKMFCDEFHENLQDGV
jgi:hypothetical protein